MAAFATLCCPASCNRAAFSPATIPMGIFLSCGAHKIAERGNKAYQPQEDTMAFKPKSASIVFYVSDIARTESFYNDVFGLELKREEGAEPFWLSGRLENGLDLVFF